MTFWEDMLLQAGEACPLPKDLTKEDAFDGIITTKQQFDDHFE